jgi:Beta-galactosidase/beta-glucuronidase
MKTIFKVVNMVALLLLISSTLLSQNKSLSRERQFDSDWSFLHNNNIENPEGLSSDITNWRKINLPHDWSVEDVSSQDSDNIVGPFFKRSPSPKYDGFTYGGTGWYKKAFYLPKKDKEKKVFVCFDGVYMNSKVWLNGHLLGYRPNGYSPFNYDLTPFLNPVGEKNVILVKAENKGKNSRWYAGSGIYRSVKLLVVNPLHIDIWGVKIVTPLVSEEHSKVNVVTNIVNSGGMVKNVVLQTQILDPKGRVIAKNNTLFSSAANSNKEVLQTIKVDNPKLWSAESPHLYKAKVIIIQQGNVVDRNTVSFGIRDIKINATEGLVVNGKSVKLKGGCIHHDNGPLGAISVDRAEERKVELLKKNGFNAIRTSHNPPSQILLDICDRLGMYVIDEAFDVWHEAKWSDDYHKYFDKYWNMDLTSMLMRDRNHPSIILWSIGNEIREFANDERLKTTKMLKDRVKELDQTRVVTEAVCVYWDPEKKWEDYTPSIFKILDVGGYNYLHKKYEPDHNIYPERIMVGTESYPSDAYGIWETVKKNPFVIGDFVWTAMDYRGESGVANEAIIPQDQRKVLIEWPWFNAFCGDLDFIGNKKPQSYYRDIVWDRSKVEIMVQHLSIPKGMKYYVSEWGWPNELKSWSWPGVHGDTLQVHVYSKCKTIQLELNGRIVGCQDRPDSSITTTFRIPYEPGTLVATGYESGKFIAESILKTVGEPFGIRLNADRNTIKANGKDLSYVAVEVVDMEGNVVPYVDDLEIKYSVEGNGELVGVGNGNPTDISSFQQPIKKVFHGKGLVILRANGKNGNIYLKASGDGLKSASLIVNTVKE